MLAEDSLYTGALCEAFVRRGTSSWLIITKVDLFTHICPQDRLCILPNLACIGQWIKLDSVTLFLP